MPPNNQTDEEPRDYADLVMAQWKLAFYQVQGDPEALVSLLATALAFATVDCEQPIEEAISRVRADYETTAKAAAEIAREHTSVDRKMQ